MSVAVQLPEEDDAWSNVILFDGVCHLCNGFVNFVIDRDPDRVFCFAPLQSPKAIELLRRNNIPTDVSTIILVEGTQLYQKSTAVLRITSRLQQPWQLTYGFICIPRLIRDLCYGLVARYRYVMFGQDEYCRMPSAAVNSRFLDMPAKTSPAPRPVPVASGPKAD